MNEFTEAAACPHCGTLIARDQGLCSTCMLGAVRYPEQNEIIIRAWIDAGHSHLEAFLTHHANFDRWLQLHKEGT